MARFERLLLVFASTTTVAVVSGIWLFPPRQLVLTLFLTAVAVVMGATAVRLDVGVISLGAIPLFAAAAVLSPIEATLVGAAGNLMRSLQTRSQTRIPLAFSFTAWVSIAALGSQAATRLFGTSVGVIVGVALACALNLVVSTVSLATWQGISVRQTIAATSWATLSLAYAYFVLASLMVVYAVVRWRDLVAATGVFALTLALAFGANSRVLEAMMRREVTEVADRLRYVEHLNADLHSLKNNVGAAGLAIGREGSGPPSADLLETGRRALATAAEILNGLGTEARAAMGAPRIHDLAVLGREAIALAEPLAQQAQVVLQSSLGERPMPVICHRIDIRDAITNLLTNAVKASPAGSSVAVNVIADSRWYGVSVRDWAGGVPDSMLEGLFTRRKTGTSGHGIGLVAADLAVREHGGTLTYQRRRRGSEFMIRLPHARLP